MGTFDLRFEPFPEAPHDSTAAAEGEKPATRVNFTIRQEGNELRAVMDPPMFKTEEGYTDWVLIPTKGGWFTFARIWQGEIAEIWSDMQVQFDAVGDRAKGFEVRAPNDQFIAKATRIPNSPR